MWNTNQRTQVAFSPGTAYVAPKTNIVDMTGATNGLPILLAVVHKPFTLLFKTYSYDDNKEKAIISRLNFQFRAHSFFIRAVNDSIKDRYEDTGYKVVKFEKKTKTVEDRGYRRANTKPMSYRN